MLELHRGWRWCTMALAVASVAPHPSHAQAGAPQPPTLPDTVDVIALDTVRVGARIDDLIGIAATSSEGRVGAVDLLARPLAREGELLETVPGLIVTQHSGEGKANQYFVRGFNLDHGTDFRTVVEGMPVNLPTHGHGQGYTDLNFLIPEFVGLLDYRLGIYHAEMGDFGSAGGAEVHLVRDLERPFVTATAGEYGYRRLVGGASTAAAGGTLLLGGEGRLFDGPWSLDQDVRKVNAIARYSLPIGRSDVSILGMAYANRWNATDQVPLRAVESGRIDRFGHIDPTDGGEARRVSLSGSWRRLVDFATQEVQLFGIFSDLDLYSNFTYFLEDSVGGDQFKQKDRRFVFGGSAGHLQEARGFGGVHGLSVGIQHRTDAIGEVGLFGARDRAVVGTVRRDQVVQTGTGVFAEADSRWTPWLRTVVGLRADGYTFDVEAQRPENSGRTSAAVVSPKASVALRPSDGLEMYLSGGFGFHSNDARGTTISIDPATGRPADPVDPLVRSRGGEVGLRLAPVPAFRSTVTAWALRLDSELLFVGDAGTTEPVDGSTRTGITWATFYRPVADLSIDADLSLARARLAGAAGDADRIPGALERVATAGVAWSPPGGPFGAVRVRHFGEYPLVEDNRVRAGSATLLNGEIGVRLGSGARVEVAVLNVLNTEASDIEYYYESRLPGEPAGGFADIHFHPAEPRQMRISMSWLF